MAIAVDVGKHNLAELRSEAGRVDLVGHRRSGRRAKSAVSVAQVQLQLGGETSPHGADREDEDIRNAVLVGISYLHHRRRGRAGTVVPE